MNRLPIPARAGIGLRSGHVADFLDRSPEQDWSSVGWIEIHAENYFAPGGPRRAALDEIARDFPLSVHGVGLSLGSADGLDLEHLARLKSVVDHYQPDLVSEHVAWSVTGDHYWNDLLPLPYTEEALDALVRNVDHAQEVLGRRILVENPSTYVAFADPQMSEPEFLSALVQRTDCGLLLDVNNIHVSGHNHGFDADAYLDGLPFDAVQEIHVSGHAVEETPEGRLLVDTHGSAVVPAVWDLLRGAIDKAGPRPVLVEWDSDLPPLGTLIAEAATANSVLDAAGEAVSDAA